LSVQLMREIEACKECKNTQYGDMVRTEKKPCVVYESYSRWKLPKVDVLFVAEAPARARLEKS